MKEIKGSNIRVKMSFAKIVTTTCQKIFGVFKTLFYAIKCMTKLFQYLQTNAQCHEEEHFKSSQNKLGICLFYRKKSLRVTFNYTFAPRFEVVFHKNPFWCWHKQIVTPKFSLYPKMTLQTLVGLEPHTRGERETYLPFVAIVSRNRQRRAMVMGGDGNKW